MKYTKRMSIGSRVTWAVLLLLLGAPAFAENAPPDGGDGFGCFYDPTFGNTVVYARHRWATFFYLYNGFEPAMPAPNWVRLWMIDEFDGADEVEVQLNGRAAFQFADYPYFGITVAQLEQIVAADSVRIEARWWQGGRRVQDDPVKPIRRREVLTIDKAHRTQLAMLARYGRDTVPREQPWLAKGAVGYVIDLTKPMEGHQGSVRQLIDDAVGGRDLESDLYCLVASGAGNLRTAPAARHRVALYQGNRADHKVAAKEFVESLGADNVDSVAIDDAIVHALNQRVQTVVLFAGQGTKLHDPDEVVRVLRRSSARLFVVWFGKKDSPAREQLQKFCGNVGGNLVVRE